MANKDELEKERKEDPTVAVKTVVKGADGNVIEITKDTTAIETEISAKEKEKVQAKIAKLSRQAPGMKEKSEETMKVIDESTPEDFSSEEVKFENVTAQQEQEAIRAKRDYTADDIKVLKGLEPVRERPGMYIGSTSSRGLHLLVREIVDNAVDEALAGYCHHIHVSILPGNSIKVTDDGRGIPCDIVKATGKSAVETTYTDLHAGGKFEGGTGYKVSGGLHGVGAKVVNALSTKLTVTVYRGGKIHQIRFENGGHVVSNGLEIIGDCPLEKTGTDVEFSPDPTIFKETTVYNYSTIRDRLRQTAFLNKGLELSLEDLRNPNDIARDDFKYDGGIKEYVSYINQGRNPLFEDIPYFLDVLRMDCS